MRCLHRLQSGPQADTVPSGTTSRACAQARSAVLRVPSEVWGSLGAKTHLLAHTQHYSYLQGAPCQDCSVAKKDDV
jgi:hypothetical protein